MVWPIIRKDWKLLRSSVIVVAIFNALEGIIAAGGGPFQDFHTRIPGILLHAYDPVALAVTALLIILIVQTDPIVALRQEWVIRPIRRRDLILSKILFVVLFVQAPIFLIEVIECLASGFPLAPSIAAPLQHSVWMLLAFDVPMLALAAITHNLRGAVGLAVAYFLGITAVVIVAQQMRTELIVQNDLWLAAGARTFWACAAGLAILAMQYYWRKTARARIVFAAMVAIWMMLELLPWRPAFAVEERLSPQPSAAGRIQLAFAPEAGLAGHPTGVGPMRDHLRLMVPSRVTGLTGAQLLIRDAVKIEVIAPHGGRIDAFTTNGAVLSASNTLAWQPAWIASGDYDRIQHEPVTIQLDYSLTLLQPSAEQRMPAAGADRWLPGVGRCATRIWDPGSVEVGCLAPGYAPFFTLFLEPHDCAKQEAGRPQTDTYGYAPFLARISGDSISRFRAEFGNVENPARRQILFRPYTVASHFTRRVTITDVRLADWRLE